MRFLAVFNQIRKTNKDSGFSLPELLVVTIMVGILSAIAVPNLLQSRRDAQAKEIFTKIRSALYEAQANADRKSITCTVNLTSTSISGSPQGCVLETTNIDSSIISVTKGGFTDPPTNISFSFSGGTTNGSTLYITTKKFNQPFQEVARCIVVSSTGMIRTGFYDANASADNKCSNNENRRYDNSI